jgi:hypothetical protein
MENVGILLQYLRPFAIFTAFWYIFPLLLRNTKNIWQPCYQRNRVSDVYVGPLIPNVVWQKTFLSVL